MWDLPSGPEETEGAVFAEGLLQGLSSIPEGPLHTADCLRRRRSIQQKLLALDKHLSEVEQQISCQSWNVDSTHGLTWDDRHAHHVLLSWIFQRCLGLQLAATKLEARDFGGREGQDAPAEYAIISVNIVACQGHATELLRKLECSVPAVIEEVAPPKAFIEQPDFIAQVFYSFFVCGGSRDRSRVHALPGVGIGHLDHALVSAAPHGKSSARRLVSAHHGAIGSDRVVA